MILFIDLLLWEKSLIKLLSDIADQYSFLLYAFKQRKMP